MAVVANLILLAAFLLGWNIGDVTSLNTASSRFDLHFGIALAGLIVATMVHALVLTYFMGTGRWLEETSQAYGLETTRFEISRNLKMKNIFAMTGCFALLLLTGMLGVMIDPGTGPFLESLAGMPGKTIHLFVASATLLFNVLVNYSEYQTISHNMELIEQVLGDVRRIRFERGLPV